MFDLYALNKYSETFLTSKSKISAFLLKRLIKDERKRYRNIRIHSGVKIFKKYKFKN